MDTIITKPSKKFPASLRLLVLAFVMATCSVYICSVCLKQTKIHTSKKITKVVIRRYCHNTTIDKSDNTSIDNSPNTSYDNSQSSNLRYPKPTTFSRAECAGNPVRLFAILSMQRSGSRWLETLLNNHTNVSSNGEIFYADERRNNVSSILSTLDRVYNLELHTNASKNRCLAAVGFKWMFNQGLMEHHKEIVRYFNDKGVSVIFLLRRNLLRRMVSLLANSYDFHAKLINGTHKAHVQSLKEAKTLSSYKPKINSKSLIMDLKLMEKTVLDVLEYFNTTRHIILYYEDLIQNRTKLIDVQKFLGLREMQLTSRNVKIHKGPLSSHINNWKDVSRVLKGTTYESFLQTDYSNKSR